MSKDGDKDYYRINGPDQEAQDEEASTGEKRSKKKLIIIISLIVIVVAALVALLLILLLKGGDDPLPSGYNGFVLKQNQNLKYAYWAKINRDNNAAVPIEFGENNKEFTEVDFNVCMYSDRTYRISYSPTQSSIGSNDTRWTVPDELLERKGCDKTKLLSFGDFSVDQNPFGFTLKNPTHKNTFWLSTKDRNLVLSDKYIECGFEIHSQQVFGWGERTANFKLSPGEYSIWNTGIEKKADPGQLGYNSFGDHPFVMARLTDKTYIGLFFKNSNAKVLKYSHESKGRSIIDFRAVGGIIDIFAFMGTTADEILGEYHKIIGEPILPPIWAFGFQQGSNGYVNDAVARQSVENYAKANIPLEVLWLDETLMDKYRLFTVDNTNFAGIKKLKSDLETNHQYLGISLHPGIAVNGSDGKTNPYFQTGKQNEAFIKTAKNTTLYSDILIGEHLGGKCAYIDFRNPQGFQLWSKGLEDLHALTSFNTLQLNYNEIHQFCDGECPDSKSNDSYEAKYDSLPFNPLGKDYPNLNKNTLSLDGRSYFDNIENKNESVVYNIHSMYSSRQAEETSFYMRLNPQYTYSDQRSFMLSRSSFAGLGQYSGHWLGPYQKCTFEDMKYSISSILSFQLFGISMTGANICGSVGEVNQEVCGRWYQLAAFYPLARTFNGDNSTTGSREAWALQEPYKSAARNALTLRLSLVRYYYTIFFENYYNGGSFWKPLFFEFPDSDGSLDKIEETFMIGSSLKVTPVLKPLAANELITTYVPANTKFIDLIDLKTIIDGGSSGGYVNVQPNWNFPIVHLREGRIIPYQNFNESKTTYELATYNTITLLVYADDNLNAEGALYADSDGVSIVDLSDETFEYYKITYNDRTLRIVLMEGYDAGGRLDMNQIVSNITIVDAAKYNNTNFACMFYEDMKNTELGFKYYQENNTLNLFPKNDTYVIQLRTVTNIQFGNTETDQNFCNPIYTVSNITYETSGEFADKKVSVLVTPQFKNMYQINMTFTLIKDDLINVEYLLQKDISEFQIPSVVLNNTLYPINTTFASRKIQSYLTLPGKGEEFYFEIHTKDNPSDIYYTTKGMSLVYSEFYKSIRSKLDYGRIFGLGERISEFWLRYGTYTVWNRGVGKQEEDIGQPPGQNLYSSHPILFAKRKSSSQFYGIYYHNSGPQELVISGDFNGPQHTNILTTGRYNVFFLLSDSISNVVKNYYNLVGRPSLPPEWAFGWHQSRFGYNSTQALTDVYKGYQNIHLPLDAIWSDVDYMDEFRDFTVDNVNFKNLSNFVETIKANGTRYVPIIVAGVSAGDSDAYFEGIKQGVFVKSPNDPSQPIIGRATSGESVFVDFIMNNSRSYWKNQMDILYKCIEFDGIWLDMNEVTNYCTGTCYIDQKSKNPLDNKLFYWPGGRDLEDGTIAMDSTYDGNIKELDAHNLHGLLESYTTAEWFKDKNQRPFIISRSTFSGSGKYSGHWTGDNFSDYNFMRFSIHSIMHFNFFGIPFTGADVCGFNGNATASLCARWYKLAVFYPFARNHNNLETDPQEPYYSEFNVTVDFTYKKTAQEIIKNAFYTRYGLHVYFYTQFHKASTDGVPVIRPLFFNYPNDTQVYDDYVSNNIMIGDSVRMSSDISDVDRDQYYFPEKGAQWCPIWEGVYMQCFTGGSWQNIAIPISEIMLHFRSGSILSIQLSDSNMFANITNIFSLDDLATKYRTDLAILLDGDLKASGDVRFDGGVTTDLTKYDEIKFSALGTKPFFGSNYIDVTFNVSSKTSTGNETLSQHLGNLIIHDADEMGFNGSTSGTITLTSGETIKLFGTYISKRNVCRFTHDGTKPTLMKNISKIRLKVDG